MLQIIRERWAKVFVVITLIAFVGLIFFGWGMSAYYSMKRNTTIGEVEGEKIDYITYARAYENALRTAQEKEEVNLIRRMQIRDKVWDDLITSILYRHFLKRNYIDITAPELYEFIKLQPPPEILSSPVFQTNGKFDTTKYYQFLNNPEALQQNARYIRYLEATYSDLLLRNKIRLMIQYAPYISKMEEDSILKYSLETAKFQYLKIPYFKFDKDTIKISDRELRTYYQKHKEDYKTKERVNLAFIKVPKLPSKRDTLLVLKDVDEIKKRFKEGEKFLDLAKDYSDASDFDSTGGDLGYKSEKDLPLRIRVIIDSLKIGEIYGPIYGYKGLYLYTLLDKKVKVDTLAKDSIDTINLYRVGEIFMSIRMTPDTRDSITEYLDSLRYILNSDNIVKIKTLLDTTGYFEIGNMIPKVGFVDGINPFISKGKIGEVSEVLEGPNSLFVFRIIGRKGEGYLTFDEVKPYIETILKEEKRKELAYKYALNVLEKIKKKNISLESWGNKDSIAYYFENPQEVTKYDYLMAVGSNTEFQAVGFLLKENQLAKKPVYGRDGVFIIKRIYKGSLDSTKVIEVKENLKRLLLKRQQKFFDRWYNNLRLNSEVKDYRYLYY